ncbi:type II secretion system F family protein [Arthrobacter sp. TMN-37]
MLLITGAALVVAALLLLLTRVLQPQPEVSLERRRPYPTESQSYFARFAGSAVGSLDRYLSQRNIRLYNREALENAGIRLSQTDFVVLVFAAAAVAAVVGLAVAGPGLAILFFLLTPAIGQLIVVRATSMRRIKFDQQLGDTLQLLTGSLRAGHSILRAIDAAAAESAAPTSEEMRRVISETSLGRDLLSSLNDTAARMHSDDFVWVSQAIQINREVGGNLAEVLDQVNETIRERGEIKGQIKALAAEGKFSAYILITMPFAIVAMLMLLSPGYMAPMFSHPLGWVLIAVSAVLMTIGSLWMRKIIDLKF